MPPRLSGTVGKSASNRPHDVALVQALLGEVKDRGRPLLKDHVSGRFDRETEAALATLFKAAGDRSPNQRLATGHPLLQKIAQNQSLTVVEGTSAPYEARRSAPKPRITYGKDILGGNVSLTPDELSKLEKIVAGLGNSLGVAFNVHVEAAPSDGNILIATFLPNGCNVHDGRRWCRNVNSAEAIRSANPMLFQAFVNEIKQRADMAFPITAPQDKIADQAIEGEFAAVIRPRVVASLMLAQTYLNSGRVSGFDLAAKLLEHYLSGTGTPLVITREEALSYYVIRDAVETNTNRIREENLLHPDPGDDDYEAIIDAINSKPGTTTSFSDTWKYDLATTSQTGIERLLESFVDDPSDTLSMILGPGSNHITTTVDIKLTRREHHIEVSGAARHVWGDEGYNFDPGKVFSGEASALEAAGLARPFEWRAAWIDKIEGTLSFGGTASPTTRPLLDLDTFSVKPLPMPPQ